MTDCINTVKYRLAKRNDAGQLARLHWEASKIQPSSFMFKLGKCFLKKYYDCILDEYNSIILCAVDQNESVIGFVSGSLDNSERIKTLHRNKFALFISTIPQIAKNPFIVKDILSRYMSQSANKENGYVVFEGPHEDFWAWRADVKLGNGAILLHLTWLKIMRSLGVDFVRGEVDIDNKTILRIHKFLGARIIKEYITPDSRQRKIIEYNLAEIEDQL